MSKAFVRDFHLVAEEVGRMAGLVADSVRGAVRALCDHDLLAAFAVLGGDDAIDRLENAVIDRCNRLLALHHPLAGDLRRVVALIQVATELERIGDLARSVAARASRMADFPPFPTPPRLTEMAGRVVGMVDAGVGAFLAGDAALARDVRGRDDAVDDDHAAVVREVIDRMKGGADWVEPGLTLFAAVRQLERIADHATNVAEEAVFAVDGEVLRHAGPIPAGSR